MVASPLPTGLANADIQNALGVEEWHHTGSFANRTAFYSAEDFEVEGAMEKILAARDARRANSDQFEGTAVIVDFYRHRRRWKAVERTVTGTMTIKGEWLTLPNGERVKMTGNRVKSVVKA